MSGHRSDIIPPMDHRMLVLGWGGGEIRQVLNRLKQFPGRIHLLDGGAMAPQLLAHLETHERVLLLGMVSFGGHSGDVYRFRGSDLERFYPLAALREAVRSLEFSEHQPREFQVIVAEPGEGAAEALIAAAWRQLEAWETKPMAHAAAAY